MEEESNIFRLDPVQEQQQMEDEGQISKETNNIIASINNVNIVNGNCGLMSGNEEQSF